MVAKMLRPDRVDDEHDRRDLEREAEALAELAHPVLLRGFGAVLDGPTRTCWWSTSRVRPCAG